MGEAQPQIFSLGSIPSPLRAVDTGRPPAGTSKPNGVETTAPTKNPLVRVAITQTSHHDANPETPL